MGVDSTHLKENYPSKNKDRKGGGGCDTLLKPKLKDKGTKLINVLKLRNVNLRTIKKLYSDENGHTVMIKTEENKFIYLFLNVSFL